MRDLTYADYLQLDTLLSMQKPRTSKTADRAVVLSEHFFIVAHQASEIWVKQILADLVAATDALRPDFGATDADLSLEYLDRVARLMGLLHDQVVVLEKLPLLHFAEFRPYLGTASGAQSAQFHELDALLGDDKRPEGLFATFTSYASERGMSVADICRHGASAGVLHRISEALVDIGNGFWRWKVAHLGMISAILGEQPGTGGSNGASQLASRIRLPFPELRRLRGEVHQPLVQTDMPTELRAVRERNVGTRAATSRPWFP
jgi:tryptophan 2,3-dioxygenase